MSKVVVVSGAAKGIGKEVVTQLVACGHRVVFFDVAIEAGEAMAAQINSGVASAAECSCKFVQGDVTSEEDWKNVMDVAAAFGGGRIDVLINNAGRIGPTNQDPAHVNHASFMRCLEVNVGGCQLGIAAVMPFFSKQQEGGMIINMSSSASLCTTATAGMLSTYSISQVAIDMLARSVVACHGTSHNVKCYSLNPCFFDTTMVQKTTEMPAMCALGLQTFEEISFAYNPLGMPGDVRTLGPIFVQAVEQGGFRYPNGASIGIMPDEQNSIVTYNCVLMLGQLITPSRWAYEPMLCDAFVFRDITGSSLSSSRHKQLRAALQKQKEDLMYVMGPSAPLFKR